MAAPDFGGTAFAQPELTAPDMGPPLQPAGINRMLPGSPLARAVAASSAFPGLLSPLTLRSYAHDPDAKQEASPCGYMFPGWFDSAIEDAAANAHWPLLL
jgi:hypothetical protein